MFSDEIDSHDSLSRLQIRIWLARSERPQRHWVSVKLDLHHFRISTLDEFFSNSSADRDSVMRKNYIGITASKTFLSTSLSSGTVENGVTELIFQSCFGSTGAWTIFFFFYVNEWIIIWCLVSATIVRFQLRSLISTFVLLTGVSFARQLFRALIWLQVMKKTSGAETFAVG